MAYSRDYEAELLKRLRSFSVSNTELLNHVLNWLGVERSCEALENFAKVYGLWEIGEG